MDDNTPRLQDAAKLNTPNLKTLADSFAKALEMTGADDLSPAQLSFIRQIIEDYEPEELPDIALSDLGRVIADFWALGNVRLGGNQVVKSLTPSPAGPGRSHVYDILSIIQSDAPFIVESLMGELIDQGVSIRSMFHPVVSVGRDSEGRRSDDGASKESMIMVFIERQPVEVHVRILEGVEKTLNDLRLAVLDFPRMLKLLAQEISALEALKTHQTLTLDPATLEENLAFLRWVQNNHFVFLGAKGYVYPRDADGGYTQEGPLNLLQDGYGILRDADRPILRRSSEPAVLNAQILNQLENSEPVTVAKANIKARVHRRVYMDYIGIKRYGADGQPSGEIRFVGLFTSEAYDRPAFEVPLIRKKADYVLSESKVIGFNNGGYADKRLRNIIETYPRDELFQMEAADLLRIARGILHLSDRPRVRVFTRTDPFDRFISVLVYIPRELYQVSLHGRIGARLADAFMGRVSAVYPYVADTLLSCLHYIIGVNPGDHFDPSVADLESDIENLTRAWPQKVEALIHEGDPQTILGLEAFPGDIRWHSWARALPAGYQERYDAYEAVKDIWYLSRLEAPSPLNLRAYQRLEDSETQFAFKLYQRARTPIALADILPILDNMGLKTLEEDGSEIIVGDGDGKTYFWVREFIVHSPTRISDFAGFKQRFEQGALALWQGLTENDGFNALLVTGADWRQTALLRALCLYRQQSGLDPSQDVQQQALRENRDVTEALWRYFELKFAPDGGGDVAIRQSEVGAAKTKIDTLLQAVSNFEQDRVLRRLAALIGAMVRTNYYQTDGDGQPKTYISFKIKSRDLIDLPEPKPFREIFVWSPDVNGVHLRFGPVARGGLRWSDRKDDFRTEVLGLVKAQQVKNAVIVPVGSKGGFYPKSLPKGGTPDAVRNEAIRAYKTFLSGLLDLTDNIGPKGEIVHPVAVVMWDEPDPYLVVAADKGTATFSDIANGVSADYGFWLGDAFASGGSVGYDHKAMGITARGAWEAVKRHFRERGKDIQSEPFTVVGVGDMSGDVFGNGLLLSRQTKLVAAFDHRDIFIDPNPDAAASFTERERLFALPRSSWQDYDKSLISKGGGVFSRGLKSIDLTPEIKALLGIEADAVSPFDLMQAILKAEAELLYFGGIGTYIKAPAQSHLEVGDKANDAIRIDATDLRVKVIGEGANLGMTQAGRIAAAQNGVRLNTDAIDNSAGVDCSDHEVNIKILLGSLVTNGRLTMPERDALLASMTDDVASHVLQHNYRQTLTLTLQEASAYGDNGAAQMFMSGLEARGKLDRKVEGLPSNAVLEARKAQNQGLFRPELAVTTAYAKIVLFDDIVASSAPDDAAFERMLIDYFPTALHGYVTEINEHRLKREIIATVLANDIVNMTGASFPARLMKSAGVDARAFVLAFEAARRLFGLNALWDQVSARDNIIPAAAQTALYQEIALFLRRQTYWLARRFGMEGKTVDELVSDYQAGVTELLAHGPDLISVYDSGNVTRRLERLKAAGADEALADRIAYLRSFTSATDIIDLAVKHGFDLKAVARLYYLAGERFGFDRLRAGANELFSADPWDRMALRRLTEDLLAEHKSVVAAVLSGVTNLTDPAGQLSDWAEANKALSDPARQVIEDIEQSTQGAEASWTFAKLTIVNAVLREWVNRLQEAQSA
ncbi:NAD-glutamate dehydrogenase [Asticcacaulis machinosus]|uniref:NAD-glutamate dehydrogenase n=1 Tax=Asticcacaulis machinosus TaxID=2984211 RepID=A0ABT5HKL7_9CAUL|nr:NAD-glutamate dehydrogenase [Asticcacaulis machinosus]MDC7676772.1 NAD-glutamate dehydrogenase [Asticcacaulis machinosus]